VSHLQLYRSEGFSLQPPCKLPKPLRLLSLSSDTEKKLMVIIIRTQDLQVIILCNENSSVSGSKAAAVLSLVSHQR